MIDCHIFQSELTRETLQLDGEILELARSLYQQKSLIVMGRGYNYATCLEGALVGRKWCNNNYDTVCFLRDYIVSSQEYRPMFNVVAPLCLRKSRS